MTRQEQEIATIKERNIKCKLSDADVDRITKMAGEVGLSVGELLEYFISDLVGGTYSNGSDERDLVENWFERCWFGMFPENTLLRYFLDEIYQDPYEFLDLLNDIRGSIHILKGYKEHPETDEKIELREVLKDDILCLKESNEEYHEIIDPFLEKAKDKPTFDLEKELNLVVTWVKEKMDLLNKPYPFDDEIMKVKQQQEFISNLEEFTKELL